MGRAQTSAASTDDCLSDSIIGLPDPRDVPWPWVLRLTDDERSFFFFNRQTGETRWDAPPGMAPVMRDGSNSGPGDVYEELREDNGKLSGRNGAAFRRRPSTFSLASHDSEELDGDVTTNARMPGKSPRQRVAAQRRLNSASSRDSQSTRTAASVQKRLSLPPSRESAPTSMLQDEEDALELQKRLDPGPIAPISSLVDRANEALAQLTSVAAEQVLTDGQSEADRRSTLPFADSTQGSRLGSCTTQVVHAVRNLLYAAGTVAISPADLAVASELGEVESLDALAGLPASFDPSAHSGHVPTDAASQRSAVLFQGRDMSHASAPASLQALGKKINATLSKLVLSARAVADRRIPEAAADAKQQSRSEAAQLEKITQERLRVRDDALELARSVEAFAIESERLQAQTMVANPSAWLRRVQGVLKSGTGTAGIGLEIVGGGAAAGWRGSGFVLPSLAEATALRAELLGSFDNPFELTRGAQASLASGKLAMRRKPTQPLTREHIAERARPQKEDLQRKLDELMQIIYTGGDVQSFSDAAESLGSSSSKPDGIARALTGAGAKLLLSQTKLILIRFGTFITLIEDIDIASAVDIDGPVNGSLASPPPELERYLAIVKRAKDALLRFALAKQGAYDVSSALLMDAQEASMIAVGGKADSATSERLLQGSMSLKEIVTVLSDLLGELLEVAEKQTEANASGAVTGRIGARAKVYGVEDTPLPTVSAPSNTRSSASLHEENQGDERRPEMEEGSSGDEVMYLGPGIAVPNGPRKQREAAAAPPPPVSKASQILGSGRGGALGDNARRPRSTSVTTGGSSVSNQSQETTGGEGPLSKILSARRGTAPDTREVGGKADDSGDEGGIKSPKSNKIRRFFGDDAPSTHEVDAALKKAEETPWFLEPDYAPGDIVMNLEGQVKGATLGALMERLTMHNTFGEWTMSDPVNRAHR